MFFTFCQAVKENDNLQDIQGSLKAVLNFEALRGEVNATGISHTQNSNSNKQVTGSFCGDVKWPAGTQQYIYMYIYVYSLCIYV